jgi:hypothetical protein
MGGDLRAVRVYLETVQFKLDRTIFMQSDLEPAIVTKHVVLAGTIGFDKFEAGVPHNSGFISRRHWIDVRPKDEFSLRGGKFMAAYGINTADHVIATKRGLGWDEGSETYNVEAAYVGPVVNVYATYNMGRPDKPELDRETGPQLSASAYVLDRAKLGASVFSGSNKGGDRRVTGPFAIVGLRRNLFVLSEWDFQWMYPKGGGNTSGVAGYDKLDYEFYKGMHSYFIHEYTRLDWTNSIGFSEGYGLGLQFFPRPHFELNMTWEKVRTYGISAHSFGDFAYVMLHFYP